MLLRKMETGYDISCPPEAPARFRMLRCARLVSLSGDGQVVSRVARNFRSTFSRHPARREFLGLEQVFRSLRRSARSHAGSRKSRTTKAGDTSSCPTRT